MKKSDMETKTNEELCSVIKQNNNLIQMMVGSLYPSILMQENADVIQFLKDSRNYSYIMEREYEKK